MSGHQTPGMAPTSTLLDPVFCHDAQDVKEGEDQYGGDGLCMASAAGRGATQRYRQNAKQQGGDGGGQSPLELGQISRVCLIWQAAACTGGLALVAVA